MKSRMLFVIIVTASISFLERDMLNVRIVITGGLLMVMTVMRMMNMNNVSYENLCRGKRSDDNEWEYGYHVRYGYTGCEKDCIVPEYASALYGFDVVAVSRCTGLRDMGGKLIFEGDIVKCQMIGHTHKWEYMIGKVEFRDDCFEVYFNKPYVRRAGFPLHRDYVKCFVINDAIEVIGNVYDNSELLGVEDE